MNVLSSIWCRIQSSLFPFLEEELGELNKKHRQLVEKLELVRIEKGLFVSYHMGRLLSDRSAIARAFVAKAVYNLSSRQSLLDRLQCDRVLRRICGWESWYDIPCESTFCRSFAEFARSGLPEDVQRRMTERYLSDHLVGHILRISTEIVAREKPLKQKKAVKAPKPKRKRGRPKKGESAAPKTPTRIERQQAMTIDEMLADLPTACDRGCKTNSKGYRETWNGYKLHLDVADGQIPITPLLTSASLHDSQAAIPLAKMTSERVTYLYELMDSSYDCEGIKTCSRNLEHVPIIDPNRLRGEKRYLDPAEKKCSTKSELL